MAATLTSRPTRTRPADDLRVHATLRALRWRKDDLDVRYPAHVGYAGTDRLILSAANRPKLVAVARAPRAASIEVTLPSGPRARCSQTV
jgi:hypothetical protein